MPNLSIDLFLTPKDVSPRVFSRDLDKTLGYKVSKIERKLTQKYRSFDKREDGSNRKKHFSESVVWIGLSPLELQTPYSEILHVLMALSAYNPMNIVDLGAGYGRVGIVASVLFPFANFRGYEILSQRLNEGNRIFSQFGLDRCSILNQDIANPTFRLPNADIYFIYDFSHPRDLYFVVKQIFAINTNRKFCIVAKGDEINEILLKLEKKISNVSIIYSRNKINVYEMAPKL